MQLESAKERFYLYNTLAILLKAVEKERTTIDLRNETVVTGTLEFADAFMNVVMKDCIFIDPRGDSFKYDSLWIQARNIRYVHIPPKIRIKAAIQDQLKTLHVGLPKIPNKRTFKMKRCEVKQQRDSVAAEKILDQRNQLKTDNKNN